MITWRHYRVRRAAAHDVWEAQFAATTSGLPWDETPPWVRGPALNAAWKRLYPSTPPDTAWIEQLTKEGPHT